MVRVYVRAEVGREEVGLSSCAEVDVVGCISKGFAAGGTMRFFSFCFVFFFLFVIYVYLFLQVMFIVD